MSESKKYKPTEAEQKFIDFVICVMIPDDKIEINTYSLNLKAVCFFSNDIIHIAISSRGKHIWTWQYHNEENKVLMNEAMLK